MIQPDHHPMLLTLNPLARHTELVQSTPTIFSARGRAGMAMLSTLLDLACFLFLDRKGGFGHGLEPSLRYRIAAYIG